jgi:two-component system, sensor histidine kinase and response regulator
MGDRLIKVLLVEDNESHAELVRRQLASLRRPHIELQWVTSLSEGLERAARGGIDATLLDLNLPDSSLGETLDRFLSQAPEMPVVVLTSLDDLEMAIEAVKRGAQDHLVKAQMTSDLLARSVGYAIERKRSQIQLERYAEELERSNRDFQHFAHFAAHELKSPLWSVSLACSVLAEKHRDDLDEESRMLLDGMVSAVQQMSTLINDLLEFSRVESRARPCERVDCEKSLNDALEALRVRIQQSGALITHDPLPGGGGGPPVWAEPLQLRQVLQNLLSNALKYRRDDVPPRIHIYTERRGREWLICVEDNGLGVPPEHRERIFGLFERVHDRAKYPGSGLGLAICKRIIERHGGKIWVEPATAADGSRFCFTLPDAPPEEASADHNSR